MRRRAGSAISQICSQCHKLIIEAELIQPLCNNAQSKNCVTSLLCLYHVTLVELMEAGNLIPSQYSSMLEALVSVGEHVRSNGHFNNYFVLILLSNLAF